jgi:hypothetical protein
MTEGRVGVGLEIAVFPSSESSENFRLWAAEWQAEARAAERIRLEQLAGYVAADKTQEFVRPTLRR